MFDDKITPEETSEENQHLIQDLQHIYDTRDADAQSLNRIRGRLLEIGAGSLPLYNPASNPTSVLKESSQRKKEINMQIIHNIIHERKTWQQRLGAIAALVLVTLLVGTLVLVLTQLHHSNEGNNPHVFKLRAGWTQIADYSGTGSKTFNNLNLQLPAFWGSSYKCSGKGKINIEILGETYNGETGTDDCSTPISNTAPQTVEYDRSVHTLQTIKVTTDASTSWHFQIVGEVHSSILKLGSEWVDHISIGGQSDKQGKSEDATEFIYHTTDAHGKVISSKMWGVVFTCSGSASGKIEFSVTVSGKATDLVTPPCDGQPRLTAIRYATPTSSTFVHVIMTGDVVWYATVVECKDAQKCSKVPATDVTAS